jgi:hypothetical protein
LKKTELSAEIYGTRRREIGMTSSAQISFCECSAYSVPLFWMNWQHFACKAFVSREAKVGPLL